jgi:hypothetical protein
MLKDEFLTVFMEITQVGIEACEDFKTVNMYHIANSDAVHDYIRDMSSYEVLTSESAARANRLGISIVAVDGVNIMTKNVFHNHSRSVDYLDPSSYPTNRRPMWLPRFRRMHICDAICLHMEDQLPSTPVKTVQSDTFFSRLRQLDEQDDFLSLDGYTPLKRIKVLNAFPDMFWKIFAEVFPPYDIHSDMSLGLLIRPTFNEECKHIFDGNMEKGKKKYINISRSTKNILDRMILGFDNIHHDVVGSVGTYPFGTDPAVLYDIIHSSSIH